MSLGDCTANSLQEICNLFAKFFQNVYSSQNSGQSVTINCPSDILDLGIVNLTYADVFTALHSINTNKGPGPDSIHPLVLKECADYFNYSLYSGIFPTRWKISHITPIFKSGSRTNIENYRGIAILPTIAKLFESIVCTILSNHISNDIPPAQHGFMKGRSTITNLLEFTQTEP